MKFLLFVCSVFILNLSFAQLGGKIKKIFTIDEKRGCYVDGGLQANSLLTFGIDGIYTPQGENYFTRWFAGNETLSGEAFRVGANLGILFRLPKNFIASANLSGGRLKYLSPEVANDVGWVFDVEAGVGFALLGDSINAPLIVKGVVGFTRGYGENETAAVKANLDPAGIWVPEQNFLIDNNYFQSAPYTGLEVMITPFANSKRINSRLLKQVFLEIFAHQNIFDKKIGEEVQERAIKAGFTVGWKCFGRR